ncbi:ATP-dependent DNA helicase RecG, partial [mine drainage metagenome]
MHRLLQGDVGAGKTVVALAGMLIAVQGGYQAALMAPTEVLAEQHFLAMNDLLSELNVSDAATLSRNRPLAIGLLTSSISAKERALLLDRLKNKELDLVVGTHALVMEGVEFASLGMVIIDEQHRFGVEQRAALRDKATLGADTLVMTATPI